MNRFQKLAFPALFTILLLGSAFVISQPAVAQDHTHEVAEYLEEMILLVENAREASESAEEATSVNEVKQAAEAVYESVWGLSSGRLDPNPHGATSHHGWQVRWQTSPAEYDEAYSERLGTAPPSLTDPRKMGIIGRGRYIREGFAVYSEGPTDPGFHFENMDIVAPLNNVIGWMRLGDGITKGEHQPRIDLTYVWDKPADFWKSTASTGWIQEAFGQAINILKTDYADDVTMARQHASSMTAILDKVLNGEDVNGDGRVNAIPMEGGLRMALESARAAN